MATPTTTETKASGPCSPNVLLKRLDDIAYGAGVVDRRLCAKRHVGALKTPEIPDLKATLPQRCG